MWMNPSAWLLLFWVKLCDLYSICIIFLLHALIPFIFAASLNFVMTIRQCLVFWKLLQIIMYIGLSIHVSALFKLTFCLYHNIKRPKAQVCSFYNAITDLRRLFTVHEPYGPLLLCFLSISKINDKWDNYSK